MVAILSSSCLTSREIRLECTKLLSMRLSPLLGMPAVPVVAACLHPELPVVSHRAATLCSKVRLRSVDLPLLSTASTPATALATLRKCAVKNTQAEGLIC